MIVDLERPRPRTISPDPDDTPNDPYQEPDDMIKPEPMGWWMLLWISLFLGEGWYFLRLFGVIS